MFWRYFLYEIKIIFREKLSIFWTLVFPVLLASFMYIAFGNLKGNYELFSHIDVAVVDDSGGGSGLTYMLDALSSGDDALLEVCYMSGDDAEAALLEGEVLGVIYTKDVRLVVKDTKESTNVSILESVLSEYKQYEYVFAGETEYATYGEQAEKVMQSVMDNIAQTAYYTESPVNTGNHGMYTNFFYAVLLMSCLFASLSGHDLVKGLQPDIKAVGIRKSVSPKSKRSFLLSAFAARLLVQFAVELIAFAYIYAVLEIEFGDRIPESMLVLLLGCMIGILIGAAVSTVVKKESARIGVIMTISMSLSVMADLCLVGIKHLLQLHVPIVNKINPAALMSDSFTALGIYSDHGIYIENVCILAAEAAVLIVVTIILLRRVRYASI